MLVIVPPPGLAAARRSGVIESLGLCSLFYFSKAKSRASKCASLFKMKKRKPFECEENKVMRIGHKRIASRCANSFTGTTSFSPFYTPGNGGAEVSGSASGILRES